MRILLPLLGLALLVATPRFATANLGAPALLDFGNTIVTFSSSQTFTLQNTAGITVTGMTITGSTRFSFDPPVDVPFLIHSTSRSFTMLFSPTGRGVQQATLTITSDDPDGPETVTLRGRGVAPVISTVATLNFGDVTLPGSADRVLAISNITSDAGQMLSVWGISFSGPDSASFSYSIANGSLPLNISPGNYSTITVRFTPTATGSKSATAHVMSNDPLTYDKTVALSGNGIGPAAVSSGAVTGFALASPTPNPSAASTELTFSLPDAAAATLDVFDVAGHRVRSLVREVQPAGRQSVRWDGRDDHGGAVHAGLYFVRLVAAGRTGTVRLALLR
jgi:hypothetical protein